ncbi:MAG: 4-alpha-glucanotransferase [Planctomycetaceae bacterium]|nr:4-alpha-glucanotransferase [Planctomycetaceae bacterium]
MLTHRSSGLLLHPTSFPTRFGIGDLGPEAVRFLDWLADAGQRYWQVLPLGPTDHGDSPYQSPAAFAGNPLLISPERLFEEGLVSAAEVGSAEVPGSEQAARVDFATVRQRKSALLEAAAARYREGAMPPELRGEFAAFREAEQAWLTPYAQFMALREANGNRWWLEWTTGVDNEHRIAPEALTKFADRIETYSFWQFLFFRQWNRLRDAARGRGIDIIGDVPIYVSHDSCDVWSNRRWFQLDGHGRPTTVAGVPPDYFCKDGQLWSNPLYNWDALHADEYRWWIDRLRAVLKTVDLVRLDHFRGFEAYWAVPAGDPTAVNGTWVDGPRDGFLSAVRAALAADGHVPIIAEDLGLITEPVHELRRRFDLPGMKVLHFRLPGDPWEPPFRIDEFEPNSVVYTGTHDNDTTRGWFLSEIQPNHDRLEQLRRVTPCDPDCIAWEFLEIAWRSSSLLAMAPLQDVLSLGGDARMNQPGTVGDHNWRWKYVPDVLTPDLANRLRELTESTGRRVSQH